MSVKLKTLSVKGTLHFENTTGTSKKQKGVDSCDLETRLSKLAPHPPAQLLHLELLTIWHLDPSRHLTQTNLSQSIVFLFCFLKNPVDSLVFR